MRQILHDPPADRFRILLSYAQKSRLQAIVAKKLFVRIHGLGHPVGVEKKRVSRLQAKPLIRIDRLLPNAQRQPGFKDKP